MTRRGTESRPRRCASDAAPRPQGAATAGGVANGPAGATAKPPLVDTGERHPNATLVVYLAKEE